MTAAAFCKRVMPSLMMVTLVGLLVIGIAWALCNPGPAAQGSDAVQVALSGLVAGWIIVLAAELSVVMISVLTQTEVAPVSRMMLTMLVRGGGAAMALALGIVAMQYDPPTVAYVAMAIYASLIASELIEAMTLLRLTENGLNDTAITTGRAS